MTSFRGALSMLFGPSRNDRYAALMRQLSQTAIECVRHFRATGGRDVKGIIDIEHTADGIVDEIHELLDNSFIMRFDISDAMRLTDDLDDVIDGMRKVALHMEAYAPHLPALTPEALELITIGEEMLLKVDALVTMLGEPSLSLSRVREVARAVDEGEARADKVVAAYERKLVQDFSAPGSNALAFIAWHQLFHLLEQMTDDANHCSKMILSLARKEA